MPGPGELRGACRWRPVGAVQHQLWNVSLTRRLAPKSSVRRRFSALLHGPGPEGGSCYSQQAGGQAGAWPWPGQRMCAARGSCRLKFSDANGVIDPLNGNVNPTT